MFSWTSGHGACSRGVFGGHIYLYNGNVFPSSFFRNLASSCPNVDSIQRQLQRRLFVVIGRTTFTGITSTFGGLKVAAKSYAAFIIYPPLPPQRQESISPTQHGVWGLRGSDRRDYFFFCATFSERPLGAQTQNYHYFNRHCVDSQTPSPAEERILDGVLRMTQQLHYARMYLDYKPRAHAYRPNLVVYGIAV